MLLLSVDIGIRNLALCLLRGGGGEALRIVKWAVADLHPPTCCDKCSLPATLQKSGVKLCRPCARSHADLVAPTAALVAACKRPYNEPVLRARGVLTEGETCTRARVDRFMKDRLMVPHRDKPASSAPLPVVARALHSAIRDFVEGHTPLDLVAIENQIGPHAIRMKAVQAMVTQCIVSLGHVSSCDNVVYVSAKDKLKQFPESKGLDYGGRKKLSVAVCRRVLRESESAAHAEEVEGHHKRDDLADAYLQGIAFAATRGVPPPPGWHM